MSRAAAVVAGQVRGKCVASIPAPGRSQGAPATRIPVTGIGLQSLPQACSAPAERDE